MGNFCMVQISYECSDTKKKLRKLKCCVNLDLTTYGEYCQFTIDIIDHNFTMSANPETCQHLSFDRNRS